MPLVDPGTRSPGRLVLDYGDGVTIHTTGIHAISSVDLTDIPTIRADAGDFAAKVAACLPTAHHVLAWSIKDPSGATLYTEPFSPTIAGTHGTNSGMPAYKSATITVLGKGASIGPGSAAGRTALRLFTKNAYTIDVGQKYLPTPYDAQMTALLAWLTTGTLRWFADFYGQHADPTGRIALQFNAHAQRVLGA